MNRSCDNPTMSCDMDAYQMNIKVLSSRREIAQCSEIINDVMVIVHHQVWVLAENNQQLLGNHPGNRHKESSSLIMINYATSLNYIYHSSK